jgi:prephenate dehydrogenase
MKKSIGLVGFGAFGQFITPHLSPYFEIWVWNRSDQSAAAKKLNVSYVPLKNVLNKDIIILCTNANSFEQIIKENAHLFNPKAIVIDVASIKIKPVELMLKHLPATCQIIGTHPLFGPQSGKYGIRGLNFVLCPVRTKYANRIHAFAAKILKLNVLLRTPEEHDKEMAYVQALTHFIARAVDQMNIPDLEQKTKAYESLLSIRKNLAGDSFDLFKTIENDNPFAKAVRENFLKELNALENKLHE